MNRAAALRAYAQVSLIARNPRDIEAEAFAKANRLLKEGLEALPDFPRYAEAIHFNQSLWDIIQRDVMSPDNPLPPELRNNLLQLSRFVDRHTLTALCNPHADHLPVLIEINRQLIEGLREQPPAQLSLEK